MYPDKRGAIPETQPKILSRLGLNAEAFIDHAGKMLKLFGTAAGAPEALAAHCARRQTQFLWGLRAVRKRFVHGEAI